MRIAAILFLLCLGALLPGTAHAAGSRYGVDGGSRAERAQVASALAASSFDFDVVAPQVTVHLARGVVSHAEPGQIWLDTDLLHAGIFSWAVVQDEFAHQVDFLLFDDTTRAQLTQALGGKTWCHTTNPGLRHGDYGCERFASTLVWAFWPSQSNAYRPTRAGDESAAMKPAPFRALVTRLVAERLAARGAAR
jgi:hypothetical protein